MQEHFNESYMESEQYPKAYFKGILLDFTLENVGRTKQNVMVRGTLNIRGVTKEMETELLIQKVNGIMALHGSFMVRPKDFGIKIPKLVENKIAKTVWVTLNFKLSPADEK
jgi:polyisoprenoid-binding protein YceI